MKAKLLKTLLIALFFISCSQNEYISIKELTLESPSIKGKDSYLDSPFLTAGNRVYMVGHQNGSFPELGWHIKGEMGGIWNHPIKLMDGFDIKLQWDDQTHSLNAAHTFVNYPYANVHHYSIPDKGLEVERWQFVPDDTEGLVVQLLITNRSDVAQNLQLQFVGHVDLRPTWLGERTQMIDAQDQATYQEDLNSWMAKDADNPWFVVYGSDEKPIGKESVENTYAGLGASNNLVYSINLKSKEQRLFNVVVAGSYQSEEEAQKTFVKIKSNLQELLHEKKQRYGQLADMTKLTIPDKKMQETFEWLKYNCDWLVRTVPEIGTGITAGIPDYPWWFGVDSEYALKGYMAIGQTDAVYSTIDLLDSVSNAVNGNGKIIHEMSTNGAVFNDGNINETPQFASLIWHVYQWNGDKEFLQEYFPTIKEGMEWLMDENDADGNLFPEGFGMMEIHGLDSEMIDVAVYTQRAFQDAAYIATELGETDLAQKYSRTARELRVKINHDFWSETFGSYADFIGTDEQTLHLIDDAIVRADTLNKPWAIEEMEQTKKYIKANPSPKARPFVLHHNWVVNTPMEMGIADSAKAIKALETGKQFVNPFGVFVTGIDRDESAGSNDGAYEAPPIFTYTGAVMTLPTGVQAVAENNYGRPNEALDYLERMTRSFSYALPGSMYEVSPDFGMMTQAWNIYSFAYPIVQQFFGIHPFAAKKQVTIKPQMPDSWDEASLENVLIGDNEISIFYSNKKGDIQVRVEQTKADWEITIQLPNAEPVIEQGAIIEVLAP